MEELPLTAWPSTNAQPRRGPAKGGEEAPKNGLQQAGIQPAPATEYHLSRSTADRYAAAAPSPEAAPRSNLANLTRLANPAAPSAGGRWAAPDQQQQQVAGAPPGIDAASYAAGEAAALARAFQQALPSQQALGQLFTAVDALHSRLEEEAAHWRALQLDQARAASSLEVRAGLGWALVSERSQQPPVRMVRLLGTEPCHPPAPLRHTACARPPCSGWGRWRGSGCRSCSGAATRWPRRRRRRRRWSCPRQEAQEGSGRALLHAVAPLCCMLWHRQLF